jgi:hypothetical protein
MAGASADAIAGEQQAGSLVSSRFLWISIDSLCEGPALRKLGIAGAVALLVGFAFPVLSHDSRVTQWPWEMLAGGPWLALIYPLIAAAVGLAAVLIPALSRRVGGALMAAAGIIGLMLCLPALGKFAGSASALMPLFVVGLVATGAALVVRSVDPGSALARKTLAAGAVLALVGLLIPVADAYRLLPAELTFFIDADALGTASPIGAYVEAFNRDPLVFFYAVFLMLPVVLLPVAVVIAWPKPGGPWDKSGLIIRPIAGFVVLYVPIGLALLMFNVMGMSDSSTLVYIQGELFPFNEYAERLLVGRAKLAVLGSVFALWAQLGTIVVLRAISARSRPGDKTRRSASESAPG